MADPRHPEATMSFLEHLEELRMRVLWSLAALTVGAGVGFWATTTFDVLEFLTGPVRPLLETGRLAYLHPTEPFMVTLKVGIFVGVVFALPVVFYHFWRFVAPGLMEREKKVFVPALVSSVGLFVLGAALSFFVVLPFALRFFLGFATGALEPVITIGEYFSFAMRMTVVFGIVFETPLVVLVLTYVGILSPRTVRRYRRHTIAAMAILSALITPADIVSMALMLVPLYLLFEASVAVASLIERRRERQSRESRAQSELPLEPGDA
ncbi:MAG: twin-arginine translocase subunit TatC [Gemmatimonadota bacterium]|nr:twin-arginine translocase subunit TatC [Gemmatimonadota bacterium]